MTPKEYTVLAMRTESDRRPFSCTHHFFYSRILHSVLGCGDESGELVKAVKDHFFYGKTLNTVKLREEYGDLLWYIAIGLDALGSSFEEVMEMNIRKLRTRYPKQFSDEAATERDLEAEREALHEPVTDNHGRIWNLPLKELCPLCRQPDSSGVCNHKKLTTKEVLELGGKLNESQLTDIFKDMPEDAVIESSVGVYHAILTGQAKGEVVHINNKYILRIQE